MYWKGFMLLLSLSVGDCK